MKALRFGHLTAVAFKRLFHGWRRSARPSQEAFNESPGFSIIELNELALADNAFGGFTGVDNDKSRQGTPLHRGRPLEEKFIGQTDARNESLRFPIFCRNLHASNVCLGGTHCKR